MKYLIMIFCVFVLATLFAGYWHLDKTKHDAIAIIINDRTITLDEFNKNFSELPDHARDSYAVENKEDFIQSLIDKELLIQESQNLGIDRDESFRRSIQNFYEQSLIKILMDRKIASISGEVTEEEIDYCIKLSGTKVHLTLFDYNTIESAKEKAPGEGRTVEALFKDLSAAVKIILLPLEIGDYSEPMANGNQYTVYRLDNLEEVPELAPTGLSRETIQKTVNNAKREREINQWLQGLRAKADIQVLLDESKGRK